MISASDTAKPFLKWAGGKTQLIEYIEKNLPEALKAGSIDTYVEPFIGSGAIFFYLVSKFKFKNICIADTNAELINTYKVIQNKTGELITELKNIDAKYKAANEDDRIKLFYDIRESFNKDKSNDIKLATHFIFLNRTCFNGLYRVNSKGGFNVPYGKYRNPKICDEANLINVSKCLKDITILNTDFEETSKYITKETFVYFDPPYRPLNITSNFTAYSKDAFNDETQKRLAKYIDKLNNIGATIMLSNSDPKNSDENDLFFDNLYAKYNIQRVHARRMINSDASKRGMITELLITNYNHIKN